VNYRNIKVGDLIRFRAKKNGKYSMAYGMVDDVYYNGKFRISHNGEYFIVKPEDIISR